MKNQTKHIIMHFIHLCALTMLPLYRLEANSTKKVTDSRHENDKPAELVAQSGHSGRIHSVKISKNGQYFLTVSSDRSVRLWDKKGKLLTIISEREEGISAGAISNDGQIIITGTANGYIKFWKKNGHLLFSTKGHGKYINSLEVSPDGSKVLSGSGDLSAKLWSMQGNLLQEFPIKSQKGSYSIVREEASVK